MIDTDKYEGHTPAPWKWCSTEREQYEVEPHPDKLLKKDAPLLLAEVKRLREQLDSLREFCHKEDYDIYNWEVKNIEAIE